MADTVATLLTERAELRAEIERLQEERDFWKREAIQAASALEVVRRPTFGASDYRVDL